MGWLGTLAIVVVASGLWVAGVFVLGEGGGLVFLGAPIVALVIVGHLRKWGDDDDEDDDEKEPGGVAGLAAGAAGIVSYLVFDGRAVEAASMPIFMTFGFAFAWTQRRMRAIAARERV